MERLNILHLSQSLDPRFGGPSLAVIKMCEALATLGHGVTVFTTNRSLRGSWLPGRGTEGQVTPPGTPELHKGVQIERFATVWPTRYGYTPDMAAALRKRVREYDVVHVHSLYLHQTWMAGRICFAAGVPYLVRPHGTLDPWHLRHHRFRKVVYEALIERPILDRAGAMHYTSQEEMRLAQAVGIRSPGVVVPLGIDSNQYAALPKRGTFRARHPELADCQLILFLGRITRKKGLDLLVRSFAKVHEAKPDVHLVIAGPDDEGYAARIRSEIRAHQLDRHVTFTGMVQGQEKLEVLADADVWVLPSHTENFGLAVLEAMCCGLPTVISDRVNIHRELADAGAALVTQRDESEISAAILRILQEPELAAQLGKAGRALAASYTWSRTAEGLASIYQRLAAGASLIERAEVEATTTSGRTFHVSSGIVARTAKPLRIAIDAVTPGASLDPGAGGMRMYVTALTTEMSRQEPAVEFVVLENRQFPLPELNGLANVERVVCPGIPSGRVGRIVYQNSALSLYLRTLRVDALLATCNVFPFGCPVPTVVVVQSLQYFSHRESYGRFRGAYLRAAVIRASRRAQSLICVSESARNELLRVTGVKNTKVKVIYHGISPAITGYTGQVAPASPPYILCVATLYRYKNLERLVEAFARFKKEAATSHRLRIIGGDADMSNAELIAIAHRLGVADDVDIKGPLPHSQIADEYARASVFVYPSLNETFGLPPLEAMTIGIPVVASCAGSIPEIVGDAAELVDPFDVGDIARGLGRILLDSRRSQALVMLGLKRAREFSWETSARRTFEVVRSALG